MNHCPKHDVDYSSTACPWCSAEMLAARLDTAEGELASKRQCPDCKVKTLDVSGQCPVCYYKRMAGNYGLQKVEAQKERDQSRQELANLQSTDNPFGCFHPRRYLWTDPVGQTACAACVLVDSGRLEAERDAAKLQRFALEQALQMAENDGKELATRATALWEINAKLIEALRRLLRAADGSNCDGTPADEARELLATITEAQGNG